jgi:hypothetical protein
MLPGIRSLAACPQPELFWKKFPFIFWVRSLAAFPQLKLFRKTFHISGEPASGKNHILLPYHPISGGRLGDDGAAV